MPVLTPSALANLATCFNSCVPSGSQLAVTNYLLAQLWKANDAMADITPAALMEGAKCFQSCIPDGMQLAVMNYTLAQILNAGGSGGAGGVTVAAGAPPIDGSITTLFYKDSVSEIKYINLGTTVAPDWDAI